MRGDVSEQLRKAILASGESQYAMAKATGVDQAVLSRFIRGERGIGSDTFAILCKHLGLTLGPK
jgi:plasmid maintenance system antidote protein VapI